MRRSFINRLAGLCQGFVLVMLVIACNSAFAEKLPVKTYTTADGLLRDVASCIVQDSRGFLWFCTSDGLSRFDGYGFTNYTTDDGLPHRVVNGFLEARDGVYWVATNDGLARLNPKGQRGPFNGIRNHDEAMFLTYKPQDNETVKSIEVLFQDARGKLWCGTDDGLYWFEQRDGGVVFHPVELPNAKADLSSVVLAIADDKSGRLWVGTDGHGLYSILPNGQIEHYTDKEGLPSKNVTSLLLDQEGTLWVGMSTNGGLCRLVAEPTPNRRVVSRCYTKRDGLAANWIRDIYQTSDRTLWLSTTNGITIFNQNAGRNEPQFRAYGAAQSLCDGEAWATREDRDGNIWVSTSCGVKKITRSGLVCFSQTDGLASLFVNGIFTSHSGELFVVTKQAFNVRNQTGGVVHSINRWDGGRFTFRTPRLPEGVGTSWGGGQIVVQDRARDWWLPGDQHAVYRFPKTDDLSQLAGIKPQAIGIPGKEVFRIYEDSRSDVWISTTQGGAPLRWERATQTIREYGSQIASKGTATCFAEDTAGNLWAGFDYGEAKLARYRDERFDVISSDEIRATGGFVSLLFDHVGRLWFATRVRGVGRIDNPNTDPLQIVWYSRSKGLSTDGTTCLVEDKFGGIYVGHGRGVDRIEPSSGQIKHFTTADGLPQGAIQFAARDAEGTLWFASYGGGLARLVPELDKPRQAPNILLTGLRVAGEKRPVSEFGEAVLPELELDSTQRQVGADFLGLGASLGEELKYQYKLEDAQRDWSEPTTQRSVDFANLAPGTYRLLVKAVTAEGTESASPAVFAFTILSPIWQRWWFVTLAATFVGLLIYGIYRYRLARLIELERVRLAIAADLHDDIGASLSRMAILSEVVKRQIANSDQQSVPLLSDIAESARGLVGSMRDIVWAIDPRRDDLSSVVFRIRQFASDVLEAKGIKWDFHTPAELEKVKLGPDQRRHIFLFFKEAITNVARHSDSSTAYLSIDIQHTHLIGEVRDDGRGFALADPEQVPADGRGGHGLENIRRRVGQLRGVLTINSLPGEGTHLKLTIPLKKSPA
jgi:ligand-binding sensor domain-containing protein/signal transduction histidine kinase